MSSTILYKFRSGTTFEALPLPGTSARLFDVKKGIVKAKRLDVGGMDFELEVSDATTNQVYTDESMLLPRGTRLVVRRVGAARGQGFVARMNHSQPGGGAFAASRPAAPTGFYTIESQQDDDEEFVSAKKTDDARELAALMAATETAQNPMASMGGPRPAASGYRPAGSGPPPPSNRQPGFPPKQQHVRPNADPELRRTEEQLMTKKKATGIPRTFLNLSLPRESEGTGDGDGENLPRLQPNAIGFEALVTRGGGQSGSATGTKRDLDYALKLTATTIPEHLMCGICNNVVKNAMLLPWDVEGRTCCETCIRDALSKSGFVCPLTGNEGVSPDDLIPNMGLRKAADLFVQGVMEKMDEIDQQAIDEPDVEEGATESNAFEGDTGDQGIIVSKKTIKEHRSKRHDDDDPFATGEDDFGKDIFDVEPANKPEDEESPETADGPAPEENGAERSSPSNEAKSEDKPTTEVTKEKAAIETNGSREKEEAPSAESEKERREARKQRVVPAGYAMGPAGGAAAASPAREGGDGDFQDRSFRGGRGGRGGRGWDRGGGYRGGRGGWQGRGGGRGRFDDSGGDDRGRYQRRDEEFNSDDRGRGQEGSFDEDHRGTKRSRGGDYHGGGDHQSDRNYRGGGDDGWDGGRGGRGRGGRFDDRRGPPPRYRGGRGGGGGGYRGRGGYGRGRY